MGNKVLTWVKHFDIGTGVSFRLRNNIASGVIAHPYELADGTTGRIFFPSIEDIGGSHAACKCQSRVAQIPSMLTRSSLTISVAVCLGGGEARH